MCSFFHSSITPSLRTPSSQRRSRASSARLAKYWPSIRRMSCISTSEDTLEIISSISIWKGVNGFGCTIVASIIIFFSGCKYTTNHRKKQIKTIKTWFLPTIYTLIAYGSIGRVTKVPDPDVTFFACECFYSFFYLYLCSRQQLLSGRLYCDNIF